MSRYQLINTLRSSESRFLKNKIKNTFFQRRNRARRAGNATAEFEAEIKQAFDERIDQELHKINQVCDNLQDDETLEVPEYLVTRGKGRSADPVILSRVIPVVGHNLSGKRCRDDEPSSPSKRSRQNDSDSSSEPDPSDTLSELDPADFLGDTLSLLDPADFLGDTVSLIDPSDFPNLDWADNPTHAAPVTTQMRIQACSQVTAEPALDVQSDWEIETLPDDCFDVV